MFTFIAGATRTWRCRGQIHGGQKIIGHALRKFGEDVGGSRRDNERFSPLRFADVLNGGFVGAVVGVGFVPEAGNYLVPGKGSEGERLHEAGCGLGHHHMHFHAASLQGTNQFRRFVRRNAPGDADRYSHIYDCSPIRFDVCLEVHEAHFAFRPQNGTPGNINGCRTTESECRFQPQAALQSAVPF